MTNHGGVVTEVDDSFIVEGKGVHLEGMKHFCPKCKKIVTAISLGSSFVVVGSKTIIMANDLTSCGAKFLPQQQLAVRESGSGSGIGGLTSILNTQQNLNQSLVKDKEEDKKCFCDKDITVDLFKKILPSDVVSKGLFYRSTFPTIKDLSFDKGLELLNKYMKEYEINTCMRKAHFLAQISCEGDHCQNNRGI